MEYQLFSNYGALRHQVTHCVIHVTHCVISIVERRLQLAIHFFNAMCHLAGAKGVPVIRWRMSSKPLKTPSRYAALAQETSSLAEFDSPISIKILTACELVNPSLSLKSLIFWANSVSVRKPHITLFADIC